MTTPRRSPASSVFVRGWNNFGCGPWIMSRRIPKGWRQVTKGRSRATDRAIQPTVAGMRLAGHFATRNRHNDTYIPSVWKAIQPDIVGRPVTSFRALIREAGPAI